MLPVLVGGGGVYYSISEKVIVSLREGGKRGANLRRSDCGGVNIFWGNAPLSLWKREGDVHLPTPAMVRKKKRKRGPYHFVRKETFLIVMKRRKVIDQGEGLLPFSSGEYPCKTLSAEGREKREN